MNAKHTPTPWKVETKKQTTINGREFKFLPAPLNVTRFYTPQKSIGGLPTTLTIAECVSLNEANAAFIVRAVNSHEELVRILKLLIDDLSNQWGYDDRKGYLGTAKEFIARAEGRA